MKRTPCSNAPAMVRAPCPKPSRSALSPSPTATATAAAATGSARIWRSAGPRSRIGSAPSSVNVFPDDTAAMAPRAAAEQPAAYSEWAGVGGGGREDGDYNLEAFVSAELTLADHLAEQLALAIADPVQRMIGQYLIDLVDEAGYLSGDLAPIAEKLGAPLSEVEAVLSLLQELRSAGRVRAQSHRVPRAPAQGAQPLRSGNAGAGRPARSACQARPRRRCGASAGSATKTSPK